MKMNNFVDEQNLKYTAKQLYEALVQSTEDFIYLCDIKTGLFQYSPEQVKMFGLPDCYIKNPLRYWKEIVHPDDWDRFYRSNTSLGVNGADFHLVEFRARTVDQEYVWIRCRGQLIRDDDNEPCLFAGIMTLMGKQNKVDSLTQLLNQVEFMRAILRNVQGMAVENMAVVVIDVDEFHQINELYNRDFGDDVLKVLVQLVQSLLPANATLYRLESDQLGILMDNATQHDVEVLYQEIQSILLKVKEWKQQRLVVEISGGCSMYPKDGSTPEDLYRYANYALQHAKNQGKNRMHFFSEDIQRSKTRETAILRQLKESILQDYRGFYLNYQPQVNAKTGKIIGVEALMRYRDDEGNFVSPAEFIPVMEENSLIGRMGTWLFETVFKEAKEWLKIDPQFKVSLNVSALQMLEDGFVDSLYNVIEQENFPSNNIVIELTESYTVKNFSAFQEKFKEMRSHGIQMAMDDFGTGYSSLEILKNAPIDIVKIDQAFVKDILHSRFDATFISFVTAICHDVDIHVCLEGVETKEEFDFLQDMNLDYIQGYYFGRPVLAEDILEQLKKQNR